MKFSEAFKSPILSLPKETKENYENELTLLLRDYLVVIKEINDFKSINGLHHKSTNKSITNNQENFIQGIIKTIEEYYKGNTGKSYSIFSRTLNNRFANEKSMIKIKTYKQNDFFYRMRVKEDNYIFSKDEMFHIPFHMRHIISTQRFSIPGFPSLYLGETAYICWEELKRPDLNKLQVSKYELIKNLRLIDLTFNVTENENKLDFDYYKQLMIWPLIASCSYKVKHNNASFKAEYIIPQFLLQWVNERNDFDDEKHQIDGIKYNSTHLKDTHNKNYGEISNIVLPVKSNLSEGYCMKLLDYFNVSDPISYNTIQLANSGGHNQLFSRNEFDHINRKLPLYSVANRTLNYGDSIFGQFEYYLEDLDRLNKKSITWIA